MFLLAPLNSKCVFSRLPDGLVLPRPVYRPTPLVASLYVRGGWKAAYHGAPTPFRVARHVSLPQPQAHAISAFRGGFLAMAGSPAEPSCARSTASSHTPHLQASTAPEGVTHITNR
jgi:hypothetical protein